MSAAGPLHHFRLCAARGAGRDDRHRPFGGGDCDGKVARPRDDGAKPELRSRQHLRAALRGRNLRRRFCASSDAASAPPGRRAPADAGAARPDGVLGVRVVDWGSAIFYPESEGTRRYLASNSTWQGATARSRTRAATCAGGSGRRLRRDAHHDLNRIRRRRAGNAGAGEMFAERLLRSRLADKALEHGIATRSDLEGIAADWRAWAATRTPFFAFRIPSWSRGNNRDARVEGRHLYPVARAPADLPTEAWK